MSNGSAQSVPQQSPPSIPQAQYTYPPVTIILTILLLIFFFIGFFSLYFCRCFLQNLLITLHLRQSPPNAPASGPAAVRPGLDPSIVQAFPTFTYSTVKDYRKEKYGLECAICLIEFNGSDVLRLLTKCCHVFHQECVDVWLESHKTCPVCRKILDTPAHSPAKFPSNTMHEIDENQTAAAAINDGSVRIVIRDGNEEDKTGASKKGERAFCGSDGEKDCSQSKVEKFSRSHSTGHSIVAINTEDRFTLRLPEHVKTHIIKGHNPSKSWSTFGEYKSKANTSNIGRAEASGEDINSKV